MCLYEATNKSKNICGDSASDTSAERTEIHSGNSANSEAQPQKRLNSSLKHNSSNTSQKCYECGRDLTNNIGTFSEAKAYICDDCVLSFYTNDNHGNVQSKQKENDNNSKDRDNQIIGKKKQFRCPICQQSFDLKEHLTWHLETCNLNVLPYIGSFQ